MKKYSRPSTIRRTLRSDALANKNPSKLLCSKKRSVQRIKKWLKIRAKPKFKSFFDKRTSFYISFGKQPISYDGQYLNNFS